MPHISTFRAAYMGAEQLAASSARPAREAKTKAASVEARCERLAMLCEAMWVILRERLELTDDELVEMINQIDLLDGTLDGRSRRDGPHTCADCGRVVAVRFAKCMYCGTALRKDPFA